MVNNKRVLVPFTCGFVAALLLIGTLTDSFSASWARSSRVVESPVKTSAGNAAALTEDANEETKSFDKCARAFFSPSLPDNVQKAGFTFTPTHFYAWFVDVIQHVIPREDGDLILKAARPYFTDKGWQEFTFFVDNNITPFLITTKDALIENRLMSAPRVLEATGVIDNGRRIGEKIVFDVDYSLRFVTRANLAKDVKRSEVYPHFVITAINLDETHLLQIDSWQVKNIAEK